LLSDAWLLLLCWERDAVSRWRFRRGGVLMDDLRAADGQAYLGARVAMPGDVMSCRLFHCDGCGRSF
jgi:hypothetical protein